MNRLSGVNGHGVNGVGETPSNVQAISGDLRTIAERVIQARYGAKTPRQPAVSFPQVPQQNGLATFANEWLNPVTPFGINWKAVAVLGVLGYGAYRLLRKGRSPRRRRR